MSIFCENCGAQINPDDRYCGSCGFERQAGVREGEIAAAASGEAGRPSFLESLALFFKNPAQLIPILALSVLWLILSLLAARGSFSWPVRVLSFLTFAQGGMYGGVWGAVGGIIGKAVFAYFFSALLMPLFSGKNPFKGMDLKNLLSGMALQGLTAAAQLLIGAGFALVVYNFFTGNGSLVNSAAGIVGLLLALKALLSRGDLLRNLFLAAVNKLSGGKTPSPVTVNRAIAGFGVGSALGVLLSAAPWPYLAYILGAALLVVGIVFAIVPSGKAVPAA